MSIARAEQVFDVAVLGAGPGGMSAAARAAQRGLSHVLLESAPKHANTVQQYQHHKHVMAEPSMLPLRSDLAFEAGRREQILAEWQQAILRDKVNVRYNAQAVSITGRRGEFRIALKNGSEIRARNLILALGVQGNPRRLGVPGDAHACIQTTLERADDHRGEAIVIVGAGDSAIENALALAVNNDVTLINRGDDFPRAKHANAVRVRAAAQAGTLTCLYQARILRVDGGSDGATPTCTAVIRSAQGERSVLCQRIITRLGAVPPRGFLEPIGVSFVSEAADSLPVLTQHYESAAVPGLFIIGALAGYPLIKQAMNQGYDVVERLLGNELAPADHPILESKLRAAPFGHDVDEKLTLIGEQVRLFQDVAPLALRELVMASEVRAIDSGFEIFLRGDYLHSVFNVLQGEAFLYQDGARTMTLREGQMFGALSLASGRPSETTAVAGPDCVLLETPHNAIRKLLRTETAARNYMDRVYLVRALNTYLMPGAEPAAIHRLSESASIRHLAAGDTLFQEGDPVDALYVVGSGSVTLSRRVAEEDVVVAYIAAGSYVDSIGELSGNEARSVSARATVATEAICVDHAAFMHELAQNTVLAKRAEQERAAQLVQYTHMQSRPEAGKILSFLMANGIGEATSVLVIDESLCIGCDQCERACASTHNGVSRLDRKAGPSYYSLHLPTSCRHCEKPHCMSDCPADAIHRQPNGEVFIDDTCIGCGKCEENCPYGVIHMAAAGPAPSLLDRLLRRPTAEQHKTAVKCDMCVGLKSGPACVNSCPTGAAIRIHAEEVMELAKKRVA